MNRNLIGNIRSKINSSEDNTTEEITTGLVVQGGGMRGVYSMGALMALEECGLGNAFNHVVGASAGAINGAYLLAEQAKLAVTVYLDDLSNKKFVDFLRFSKIVDIDYLVDGVLKKHKALDIEKLRQSDNYLHVVMTDYLTASSHIVTNKDENVDIMEAIRATAALPILYGRVVKVKDRDYIDGGVIDMVPLFKAIKLGCTDIIIILTRQPSFRRSRPHFLIRLIEYLFLWNLPKATKVEILSDNPLFNKTMEAIENPSTLQANIRIGVVYPSDLSKMASRTTNNRDILLECALMARNDTRKILGLAPLYDNPFN